jgi:hypothetical protein
VKVEARTNALAASQVYTVGSRSQAVRIASEASVLRSPKPDEQLIALDARLRRGALTKIYPNFVGMAEEFGNQQLHFGYRFTHFIPEYFTCMKPGDFPESVSLVLLEHQGLSGIRQGFWPAERGRRGACEFAWIELLAQGNAPVSSVVDVLLHKGHQPIAAAHLASERNGPLVIVPGGFAFEEANQ